MVALLLLLACQPDPEDAATPWSYEPTSDREADLSIDVLEEALATWLPALRTVDARPAIAAFDAVTAHADGLCPAVDAYEDAYATTVAWYSDGCQTPDGAAFQGYAQRSWVTGVDDNGWSVYNDYVYGVAAAVTPAGEALQISGYVAWAAGSLDHPEAEPPYTEQYEQHVAAADVSWDGAGAAGTWLTAPVALTGGWGAYTVPGFGAQLTLDGTITGDLGDLTALAASNLTTVSPQWRACPSDEPNGVVSLRDAAGGWYDVIFQGSTDPAPPPEACDGCGELWFEGERVGEVCPDLSGLLAGLAEVR